MTTPEPKKGRRLTWLWVALAFFIGLVAMAGIAFLLTNIQTHKNEEVEYPLKTVSILYIFFHLILLTIRGIV